MPAGNPPSNELNLYNVWSDGIGSFGPSLNEITRLGLRELRYIKGADRGETTNVSAIHMVQTEQEAKEYIETVTNLLGTEITLYSTSTEKSWSVFLIASRAFYRPMESTNELWNYIIRFQLELQRTQ